MNHHLTSSPCLCSQCPGSACTCGCQDTAPPRAVAGAACNCGGRCGCDAAEQGCLCAAGSSQRG